MVIGRSGSGGHRWCWYHMVVEKVGVESGVGAGDAREFATGSTKGVCTFHGAMRYEENLEWTGAIDWFKCPKLIVHTTDIALYVNQTSQRKE